jgi:hypothetical protein
MPRRNGSYFGLTVAPTTSAASGIWRVREAEENLRVNKWPATPGVPGSPVAVPGNGQVSLTWSAPSLGSPPTDYQVQYSSNSGTTWTTFSDGTSTATSAVVSGLTNGTGYIFRVRAVNALGEGPYGAASGSVTPAALITSLLLHFDGSTFIDSSPNAFSVTANGDVSISTAYSVFGGASGFFNGGYLAIDSDSAFGPGEGDFTVECWVRPTAGTLVGGLINLGTYDSGLLWRAGSNPDMLYLNGSETTWDPPTNAPLDTWTHLALVRSGSLVTVYANGVAVHTRTSSANLNSANAVVIGTGAHSFGEAYYGYIDELRIVKGTAIYTANFTPPTAPF